MKNKKTQNIRIKKAKRAQRALETLNYVKEEDE